MEPSANRWTANFGIVIMMIILTETMLRRSLDSRK